MSIIEPATLDEQLANGADPYLLDIRPPKSYEQVNIDGSEHLPVYSQLQRRNDEPLLEATDSFPEDRQIVVICKAGVVAKRATQLLNKRGFEAATLRGGIQAWVGYQNGSLGHKIRSGVWNLRS